MRAIIAAFVGVACSREPAPVVAKPPPTRPAEFPEFKDHRPETTAVEVMHVPGCYHKSFVIDDGAAYVACDGGDIYAAQFGSPATLLARGTNYTITFPIAVDGTRLFFLSSTREISVVPKQGGAALKFHSNLHVIAMTVAGTDLFVSAFQQGIVRLALASGIAQPVVPAHAARVLAVDNSTAFFLERSGDARHAFSATVTGAPAIDLGEVGWGVHQIAAAGGRLFASAELEVASMVRHKLPANACSAFVSDGSFVFGACYGGIYGREVAGSTWQSIADEFVQDNLALNATQVCWADTDSRKFTRVRCIARPDGLR